MDPRVTKRDRKLHLSYELSQRTHSAHIYPVQAPNGSTVVIYSHDRGVRILWRGGRSRKQASQAKPNGSADSHEVIILDDDDEQEEQQNELGFEDDEEELDPDCPYPNMIQDADVELGAGVTHVAIPALPKSLRRSDALSRHGAFAVACTDGSQKVLTFDLSPPSKDDKQSYTEAIRKTHLPFPSSGVLCTGLAAKIADDGDRGDGSSFLMVAVISDVLRLYRFAIFNELTFKQHKARHDTVQLRNLVTGVTVHPLSSSTALLLTDASGAIRIFDPYAPSDGGYIEDEDEDEDGDASTAHYGRWLMCYHTSYVGKSAARSHRKHVLDAKWVLNGKAVLALLEDGEWGIWDYATNVQQGRNPGQFVLQGYLGASASSDSASTGRQAKGSSRQLAPMTPNTRRAKASENLFGGVPRSTGSVSKGGISVSATSSSRTGQADESVIMWHGHEIYSISSMQTFWQRSTGNTSGSSGSLYAPAITHITDINLMNEEITSISQFAPNAASSGVGQMNTQRDLLVFAEHRLIILQTLRPPTPARPLFQQALAERPASRDQKMLDAGELDVGGLDRMLDSMANGDARPRRVGFAH